MDRYQKSLQAKEQSDHLRSLSISEGGIDFYSNDYLGFARDNELSQLIIEELHRIGPGKIGSTGSRLISGNNQYIVDLENHISDFHGFEASLFYCTGYMANLGVITSLVRPEDTLFVDELCHASIVDAARLCKAKKVVFRHNDVDDIAEKLQNSTGSALLVVESLYSMNGDICKLEEIVEVCKLYNAKIIVDEAHAMGTIGSEGKGLINHLDLADEVLACIVTYGKAMGTQGAAVLSTQTIKEYQINFARTFIFTTAPSYLQTASVKCAYVLLKEKHERKNKLSQLVKYFVKKSKNHHRWNWLESTSQIQSLMLPGNEQAIAIGQLLNQHNILAKPIRHPSVAAGKERIRICLHSFNTEAEIDHLFSTLEQC